MIFLTVSGTKLMRIDLNPSTAVGSAFATILRKRDAATGVWGLSLTKVGRVAFNSLISFSGNLSSAARSSAALTAASVQGYGVPQLGQYTGQVYFSSKAC